MEQLGDMTGDDTSKRAIPSPPPPAERPDRIIGGVAATIATRLGVDALWVRLAFVVLGLVGGIGVVVYGALWLVLAGESGSRAMRIAGGALLVAGVPLLIADGGQSFITGPFAVILLLAGLALALWQPRREQVLPVPGAVFPPPVPAGPSAPAPQHGLEPGDDLDGSWHVLADAMRPPADGAPTRRWRPARREPSLLGRVTLFVAVYVAAAWALADQLDGGRLHPEQWLGAAAVICGAGMLIGTVVGRARWLIVPAVLAAGAGYGSGTMARMGITAGDMADDRYVAVGGYSAGGTIEERVGMGELRIVVDSAPTMPVHVDARVAFGRIELQVPADVTVELRPRVDHGSVNSNQGLLLSETEPTRIGSGSVSVVVDAWVGLGDVDVTVFDVGDPDGPRPMPPTGPPDLPGALLPEASGALVPIRDGIQMTTDGWVVLGAGEAVISPDDVVTSSAPDVLYPEADGTDTIYTGWGSFRLLPRSLLLTPDGQVLDLQALRAGVTEAAAPTTPDVSATTTVVPVTTIPGG
jgi:phage shock protein PspC (stress-responsive transcriptional regulator)